MFIFWKLNGVMAKAKRANEPPLAAQKGSAGQQSSILVSPEWTYQSLGIRASGIYRGDTSIPEGNAWRSRHQSSSRQGDVASVPQHLGTTAEVEFDTRWYWIPNYRWNERVSWECACLQSWCSRNQDRKIGVRVRIRQVLAIHHSGPV